MFCINVDIERADITFLCPVSLVLCAQVSVFFHPSWKETCQTQREASYPGRQQTWSIRCHLPQRFYFHTPVWAGDHQRLGYVVLIFGKRFSLLCLFRELSKVAGSVAFPVFCSVWPWFPVPFCLIHLELLCDINPLKEIYSTSLKGSS